MSDYNVPLWIIGGFLGSGKTTVLNHLLAQFADEPVGVLVNDFGKIGVDSHLVESTGETAIVEVNGGQIFCSCVSSAFVDRLRDLAATPARNILVEASGMTKPYAMKPILDEVRKISSGHIQYAGMVSVVDAGAFHKLAHAVNAVEEQVVYGDLLVVNKCDMADADRIAETDRMLRRLNGVAPIIHVEYGGVARSELPRAPMGPMQRTGAGGENFKGWNGRKPICRTWRPPESISIEQLREELEVRVRTAFRIKGYIGTADGPVFVSATTDNVRVQRVPSMRGDGGLTEFYPRESEPTFSPAVAIASGDHESCDR